MKKYKKSYVEITNVCNLSCSFCHKTKRNKMFMTPDDFRKALTQISTATDYIYLHIMGEPLLHPQLDEILKVAEEFNVKVIITTNGTLIKEKSLPILKSKCVDKVVFSLHSFEANEISISLNEYLDDIFSFARQASDKTDIISVLRLWNLDGENTLNRTMLEEIKKFFGTQPIEELEDGWKKDITLYKRVFLQSQKKFEWPDISKETISNNVFCYGLRDHFGVLCDGSVVPCCLDCEGDIILGNLFKDKLSDILESERAKNIYDGFSQRKPVEELCRRCHFSKRF